MILTESKQTFIDKNFILANYDDKNYKLIIYNIYPTGKIMGKNIYIFYKDKVEKIYIKNNSLYLNIKDNNNNNIVCCIYKDNLLNISNNTLEEFLFNILNKK